MKYLNDKKNKNTNWVIGVFVIIILVIIVMNCFLDWKSFIKGPVFTSINSLIAIIFAYYLSNKNNENRKLKEKVEQILSNIYNEIDKPIIVKFESREDLQEILLIHRNIANNVGSLLKIAEELKIKDSLDYINERFNEYRDFFGEHYEDLEYLKKSINTIMKDVGLIKNKIDDIIINLYLI